MIERRFGDGLDLTRAFLRGLNGKARIGEQGLRIGRGAWGNQQQAIVAGEAAEVAHIGRRGDKKSVDFQLAERNAFAVSRHGAATFRWSYDFRDRDALGRLPK